MNVASLPATTSIANHPTPVQGAAGISLTQDQQNAYNAFISFLLDPNETVFVLSGYSGTGKTTLVRTLLEQLPQIEKTVRLLQPSFHGWDVALTATTNKAAEAFSALTHTEVRTIYSLLGVRVRKDYSSGRTSLDIADPNKILEHLLIFIDEASFLNKEMMKIIFQMTRRCKIVFMGDPAQLLAVRATSAPVFESGFRGAHLSEVVRQAEGNPILELGTGLRQAVITGEFPQCKPDGYHIQSLDHDSFMKAMEQEFVRPDWRYNDSKFLAWTNKCVIHHNHLINSWVMGTPEFAVGDYAVCNHYMASRNYTLKTDQLVQITAIRNWVDNAVPGKCYEVDNKREVFVPDNPADRNKLIAYAKGDDNYNLLKHIDDYWADLRAAYACTIDKSQGSTYRKVFIDLNDVSRCQNINQLARMLYVGITRASEQVILTGDIV